MRTIVSPLTGRPLSKRAVVDGDTIGSGQHVLFDTASGNGTLSAPVSLWPDSEDAAFIVEDVGNAADVAPITVNGNGRLIDGAATASLDVAGAVACFLYDPSSDQWRRAVPVRLGAGDVLSFALTGDLPRGVSAQGGGSSASSLVFEGTGVANEAGAVTVGAGWRTLVDLDFRALATQSLDAVGAHTIGGVAGWSRLVASPVGVTVGIVEGVGLSIQNAKVAATQWSSAERSPDALLQLDLGSLLSTLDRDTRWRARVQLGATTIDTVAGTSGSIVTAVDNGMVDAYSATNRPFAQGVRRVVTAGSTNFQNEAFVYGNGTQSVNMVSYAKTDGLDLQAFVTRGNGLMLNAVNVFAASADARFEDDVLRLWRAHTYAAQSTLLTGPDFQATDSFGNLQNSYLVLGVAKTSGTTLGQVWERVRLEYRD